MILYKLSFSKEAAIDLSQLPRNINKRIVDKIEFFGGQPNPLQFAKKLTNNHIGGYRFRIGDYRAIFDIRPDGTIQVLMILRVKHRKDIYGL